MRKHSFLLLIFSAVLMWCSVAAQPKWSFEKAKMGSPFVITICTSDSAQAAAVAEESFALVDSLNQIFSDYIDSSEINRLSQTSGTGVFVPVSQPLFSLLVQSQGASVLSAGAFDITIGPVVRLWRTARRMKALPAKDSLIKAKEKTGFHLVQIDAFHHAILLQHQGMQLDAGGIAKGFVAQSVSVFLKEKGFSATLVNAGGNMVAGDAPGDQKGWRIAIEEPGEREETLPQLLSLTHVSVSTSGNRYQHVEIGGKTYSHIVNPKTGVGLTHSRSVTVIAKDGAAADWLSTACSVLSPKKAMRLIKKVPGAAVLITEKKRGKIEKKSSALFKNNYF